MSETHAMRWPFLILSYYNFIYYTYLPVTIVVENVCPSHEWIDKTNFSREYWSWSVQNEFTDVNSINDELLCYGSFRSLTDSGEIGRGCLGAKSPTVPHIELFIFIIHRVLGYQCYYLSLVITRTKCINRGCRPLATIKKMEVNFVFAPKLFTMSRSFVIDIVPLLPVVEYFKNTKAWWHNHFVIIIIIL